jgi:hypothetical protein
VGAGASDFREGSIYEFGEHGAEGESEKLHQEIFDVGRENGVDRVDLSRVESKPAPLKIARVRHPRAAC